ncbi:MAG: hypothetical protein GF399_08670 [Candidatus Coatesbacteria bacterium]|nr:hypothetical protein [Candidatus Coatesbacteria bacterium]
MRDDLWLEFEELLDDADALCDQGRHEESLAFYERAEELTLGLFRDVSAMAEVERFLYASLYNNWGAALTAVDPPNYPEAVERYRFAIQIKPDFQHALANLGLALVNKINPEFDAAVAHYRRALAVNPDFHPALYNWGLTLMDMGEEPDHFAVIDKFERVLELEPEEAGAHYHLACTYARLGNRHIALDYLAAAIQIDDLYADDARLDEAFAWLRQDRDFRRLVGRRQN